MEEMKQRFEELYKKGFADGLSQEEEREFTDLCVELMGKPLTINDFKFLTD